MSDAGQPTTVIPGRKSLLEFRGGLEPEVTRKGLKKHRLRLPGSA